MTNITRTLRMAIVTALTLNPNNELTPKTVNVPYTNKKSMLKEVKESIAYTHPELEFVKVTTIHRIFDCKVEMPVTLFYSIGNVTEEKEVNALEA